MAAHADDREKSRAARRWLWLIVGPPVAIWLLFLGALVPAMWELGHYDVVSLSGPTMGTRYNVTLVTEWGEPDEHALRHLIDERLAEVNSRMSTYDPESELSRFNASESTAWFDVSADTASVVRSALDLAADSRGAYDPTVGPLVNLWGFGPGKRRSEPPTDEEVRAAMEAIGHELVDVRLEPPALRKARPRVYLDLSSIAKGHGVDAVAEILVESGVAAFMVEIGGEVRTRGSKPGDYPWRIGVERADPASPAPGANRPLQSVVELSGRALATSGDYRNFFQNEGVRYSHTIDPLSGRPVTHDLATVTVLADSCRDADGLATALLVLGPTAGYDWASERGIAALFVSRIDAGGLVERTTSTWDQLTRETSEPRADP